MMMMTSRLFLLRGGRHHAASMTRCLSSPPPGGKKQAASASGPLGIAGAAELSGDDRRMQVTEYDDGGFEVQGDVYIPSSIALLPHTAYLWRPRRVEEINFETLRLFTVVFPRPEIVVVGLGEDFSSSRSLGPEIITKFMQEGIMIEQMNTRNAVHTFNILNDEGRTVGGAILTPKPRSIEEFADPFEGRWR